MSDTVVNITDIEDRIAALEAEVAALKAVAPSVDEAAMQAAVAKVHELVKAWNAVPLNGWRGVGDF